METDPITALNILESISYGRCKYCLEGYSINKNGKVRKHKDCPIDYPDEGLIRFDSENYWIEVDGLKQIAAEFYGS